VIDDIAKFVKLRDILIKDYNLKYVPHIHADSVIGWIWLMFNKYDFKENPLKISPEILPIIEKQFKRAYKIRLADSWGVDFHKALGGCPTPCGLFVSNKGHELMLLSKSQRGICDTHHLGGDWSIDDPSDITLETSRSAGPALAALGSLLTMGKNGFRRFLANQIVATKTFRNGISNEIYFIVGNPKSLGFNTMVIISPKEIRRRGKKQNWESFLSLVENDERLLINLNNELKLFYEWNFKKTEEDYSKRLGCSFSKSFYKTKSGKTISGLKYCLVSPHTNISTIKKEIRKLEEQFKKFSKMVKNEFKL
jgi:glutamate/tyrosine decarboxylase-like PLP-dependent enzyme|tara:strand:+ start:65 stop:991 length:927 start_codon:yes stop_codon:yes gene_type:complete